MLDSAAAILNAEQTGRDRRAANARSRKTPQAKEARNRGRAQRGRGYRAEKRIADRMAQFGWRRVPLSGAAGGSWSGDLRSDGPLAVIEVKHRQADWPGLRRWLAQGGAEALVLDAGAAKEPLVVLELKTLERLLGGMRDA